MKKQLLKKLAVMLCIPLFSVNVMGVLTHGSIKGTAVGLYDQYDGGTINLTTLRTGKTCDFKVVTIGNKSWGLTNLTGTTIQGNGWSSQLRYWGGTGFTSKTENWLQTRIPTTNYTLGTTTATIPSPLQLSFLQEISPNEFTETQRVNYDITTKNSSVIGDVTAPVISSCTATNVTGTSATLNITGSDNLSDLFYYVTGNGISEVMFLSSNTLTGLTPSTAYNLTVTPIDFSGNEGTPATVQFKTTPNVSFTADNLVGFPVMTVTFTNTTTNADTYEWNFGDGTALSTATNPTHAYQAQGTYTVTLKATNTSVGVSSTLVKTNFITVNAKPTLPVGELLYGGNMENANFWLVDYLNTGAGKYPTATWNNTTNVPSAGSGGCLYVNSTGGSDGIQYAIYQKVSLIAGHIYEFNGAFKDLTANLSNFWAEVYIGSMPAGGGADYGTSNGTLIAKFDIWGAYTGNRIDGTFKLNANTFNTYTATSTADFYFVAKMGTWWGSGYQILLDNLSLKDLSLTTSIKDSKFDNYKISTSNNIIHIENIKGNVSLFDIAGRKIQSVSVTGTLNSKTLNSGMYIVSIDGNTTKVSVK
jgi:PKD repeat protein